MIPQRAIRGFADAHDQHVARDFDVLDRLGQGEAVRRDEAVVALHVDERPRVEVLRIDDGSPDVGEHLELPVQPDVVAVAGDAVGDDARPATGWRRTGRSSRPARSSSREAGHSASVALRGGIRPFWESWGRARATTVTTRVDTPRHPPYLPGSDAVPDCQVPRLLPRRLHGLLADRPAPLAARCG